MSSVTTRVGTACGTAVGTAVASTVRAPTPSITSAPWVGDVAVCDVGGAPGILTYQWKRDGSAIPGATSSSYTYVAADIGPVITCEVTRGSNTYLAAGVQASFVGVAARTGSASDLVLHWDTSDLLVGSVTTWTDRVSGYVLSGAATCDTSINGKKTLVFSGSGTGFTTTTSVAPLSGAHGFTACLGALPTYGATAGMLYEYSTNAAVDSGFHLFGRVVSGNQIFTAIKGTAGSSAICSEPGTGTAGIYSSIGDFALLTGEAQQVWKNGQIVTSTSNSGNTNDPTASLGTYKLNLGMREGGSLRYVGKMVGAVVFFKRPLTWEERQHVELINGYLSGIPVNAVAQVAGGIAFGLGGQSNALGNDTDLSSLDVPWPPAATAPKLQRYLNGTFSALVEPVNGVGGTFTVSFADAVIRNAAYSANPKLAIATAPPVASTSITQWAQGTTNYNRLMSAMYTIKVLHGYRLGGLLWYQGEADTGNSTAASLWLSRTQAFLAALRADLKEPNLRVIAVKIHPTNPGFPEWNTVYAAADSLADANTTVVPSSGALLVDNTHLTTLAEKALGEVMAAAFLA